MRANLVFLDELSALVVVRLHLLFKLHLSMLGCPLQSISLLCQLLVIGLKLLSQEGDLSILGGACLI